MLSCDGIFILGRLFFYYFVCGLGRSIAITGERKCFSFRVHSSSGVSFYSCPLNLELSLSACKYIYYASCPLERSYSIEKNGMKLVLSHYWVA